MIVGISRTLVYTDNYELCIVHYELLIILSPLPS